MSNECGWFIFVEKPNSLVVSFLKIKIRPVKIKTAGSDNAADKRDLFYLFIRCS